MLRVSSPSTICIVYRVNVSLLTFQCIHFSRSESYGLQKSDYLRYRSFQAIQANPQQFINLLQEAPGGGGGGDAPANPQAAPPPGTVQITPAEKEAIDRVR